MIKFDTKTLGIDTQGFNDIIDITPQISQILIKENYKEGQILIFVPGSTAALTTMEFEPGLQKDIREFFEEWIPMKKRYHHNETWHDGNGYAHVRASMLKPSLNIPFKENQLLLGTWQQIILIDFDNRKRKRSLIVQIMGEAQ